MADYKQLREAIDKKLSTDPEFRTIVKRINSGRATLIDTERYAQITARTVSKELSGSVLDLADREKITAQVLRDSYDNINEVCTRVQKAMDEKAGIHIRPQQAAFPGERVEQFVHSLVDPTVEDAVIKRRARAGSDTIVKSAHDDFIRKNATFRNDAGLTCYIIREGSNCCEWCSSVAGKYKFGTQPDDIFRRHDNCDCTIIYDGQVLRGKQNADGSRSKTWEEVPDADGNYNPTVLSPEEAERLQAKNQPQILTNGVNGGKISSGSDNMAEITKLGKIDTQPLEQEFGKLKTDEIIVTNERLDHIKTRHPEDYSLFEKYGVSTVESPDLIISDLKNDNTVFMVKSLDETNLNVVAKLILDTEETDYKNSVMTFYRIRNKNLVKLEKKNKTLYKKE